MPLTFWGVSRRDPHGRPAGNWPERMYLETGTHETGNAEKDAKIIGDVRELESILCASGLDERRLKVRIDDGATHSESAWARRFPEALEFLFSS